MDIFSHTFTCYTSPVLQTIAAVIIIEQKAIFSDSVTRKEQKCKLQS